MNKLYVCFLGLIAMLTVTSCKNIHNMMRADAATVSAFLPHHELLVRQDNDFPFHYIYVKSGCPIYEHVYIAPVDYAVLKNSSAWNQFNDKMDGKLEENLKELCDYARERFIKEFKAYEGEADSVHVAEKPDKPKCLTLELAITGLRPSKGELNLLGFVGGTWIPCLDIVTGYFAEGSLTMEGRIKDSNTGELIAMFSTTEVDEKAMVNVSNFTWMSSAKSNIITIANLTARLFNADDYSTIKRDFPYKILAY